MIQSKTKVLLKDITKVKLRSPLFHKNKFATDFKEKAELFNYVFSKQCSLKMTVNSLRDLKFSVRS